MPRRRGSGLSTGSRSAFPGAVRDGRVLTAPNLGTELWAGFDLQATLSERWGKPVRVMNDADVQGFGAITARASRWC